MTLLMSEAALDTLLTSERECPQGRESGLDNL